MFSPVPQNLQRIETQSVCSFLATPFKLEVAFLQSCPGDNAGWMAQNRF